MYLKTGIAALLAVAALAGHAAPAQAAVEREAALEDALVAEINELRAARHLAPLRLSSGLAKAADGHSRAMARRGFFAHESSDGSAFWRRIERAYPDRGHRLWAVGENLVWGTELTAELAIDLWLASPAHRRNLLHPRWREIGIAGIRVPDAPGVFEGQEVTIVTADFGVRF